VTSQSGQSTATCASLAPTRVDPSRFRFVDTEAGLSRLLDLLDSAHSAPVSIDTEADSFHHYFEKVCLIQVGTGQEAFLVDPLKGADLSPLIERLARRPLFLHGADYDLRLLKRGFGFTAASIFDTMIAAQLLGEKEIGLAALLLRRAGVVLDKSNQRDDWSVRPLQPAQLAYAAADVLFLGSLVDSLQTDLERMGRLEWHREECERLLLLPFLGRQSDPENDWRIKGTNALSARERAFVRSFWEVREARAQELDRPPFRVFTNERLIHAARTGAGGVVPIESLFPGRPLPDPLRASLEKAAAEAAELPATDWPGPRRGEAVAAEPALENEVTRLKVQRDRIAAGLALDPGIVASRAVLTAAARVKLKTGRLDVEGLVSEGGLSRWRAALLAGG
jgi:ribonuclease D